MKNFLLQRLLKTILICSIFVIFAVPAQAENNVYSKNSAEKSSNLRDWFRRHKLTRACKPYRGRDVDTIKCFNALIANPRVRAILSNRELLAGVFDGRLDLDEIAHQLQVNRTVPSSDSGNEPSDIHELRNIGLLPLGTIDDLISGEGFDIAGELVTPKGPILAGKHSIDPPGGFPLPPKDWASTPENPNYLDIAGFTDDLHKAISPNVNGYAMHMRRKGQTVSVLQWNWARNPKPSDLPALGWSSNRRMHIASISKFMSTIGLIHLLDAKGIPTDSTIAKYLPTYWSKGTNVDKVTFEDLMNHKSGFNTAESSSSTWSTMKSNVASNVSLNPPFIYGNMNFGLIRILMSTIGGYINPSFNMGFFSFYNDFVWDNITASAYNHYMQTHVFNPVGAFPLLNSNPNTVLASRFDSSGPGWNTGNFTFSSGGAGWHMTINEILDVVRALRSGNIVSGIRAQTILNESWGLNSPLLGRSTDTGRLYYKAGKWTDRAKDTPITASTRTEMCFVMMMPDEMELVIFVNSEITATGTPLTNLLLTLYNDNIVIVEP